MKAPQDIPGNAVGSAEAHARYIFKYGEALVGFDYALGRLDEDDIHVKRFRVRVAEYEGDETLVTVTADVGGEAKICFHAADGFAEAVRGMMARLVNRTAEWKEDKYAKERDDGGGNAKGIQGTNQDGVTPRP